MTLKTAIVALVTFTASTALATQTTKKIAYEIDKAKFESVLIYEEGGSPKPGLVLVPNWLGVNEANLKQAKEVAARGYTVLVADVFGVQDRPKNQDEAGKISGALKSDRALLRKRVTKAWEMLATQKGIPLDTKKIGATGFCFGGTAALELARTGANLAAVVTFHAGLSSPAPADAKNIKGKVLAMHGADDPFVPPQEVQAFEDEMRAAKVDWQLVSFGNSVHSFTDVDANMPGKAQYNPAVAKRAYVMMDQFFGEAFAAR